MSTHEQIGIQIPEVYLPKAGIDLTRWAVVACDQFTCEPEYWDQVRRIVGQAPSTYHLVLPEIYLGTPEEEEHTQRVHLRMQEYLDRGVLESFQGLFYVERSVGKKFRKGLVLCLDLEQYDYHKGSQSLIRATEGTILERLPQRMRIREKAPLELPHILVLIDDPGCTVIEPLAERARQSGGGMLKRYDFDLMLDGGHLAGYQVVDPGVEREILDTLEALADPESFRKKYGVGPEQNVFLFAMGDGNHSLAAAKAIWEKLKPQVGLDHPARCALVEVVNVHDNALEFEAIHRALFGLKRELLPALGKAFGPDFSISAEQDLEKLLHAVDQGGGSQRVGFISKEGSGLIEIRNPASNLAVGTLQAFLDEFMQAGGADKIDYVHGKGVLTRLGLMEGNAGFYLPCMHKNELFKTVILDGALPRKTFSMGEAREKRFYMESRKIVK